MPPHIKVILKANGHFAHQAHMNSTRANIASSSNVIRHSAARQVDEIGPAAAAAINKMLALP